MIAALLPPAVWRLGGGTVAVIAGPCAVESQDQLRATAHAVKAQQAAALRGGAFKPRTSPYAFQGLMAEGLAYLHEISAETGLPVVTEVINPADVEMVAATADIVQIGARNMQNYPLLKEGASCVSLSTERGPSATV